MSDEYFHIQIMKTNPMRSTWFPAAVALGMACACAPCHAATVITIQQAGFEGAPSRGAVNLSPWRRSSQADGSGNANQVGIESYASLGTKLDAIPGGGNYLYYNNSAGESIYQTLAATLAANTTYTLSIQAIDRSDLGFQASSLRLGYVPGTDNGSTGDLIANSFYGEYLLTPTSVVNPTPINSPVPSTNDGTTNPNDGWQLWTYTFTTGASPAGLGSPLRVEIVGSGIQSLFDNISLTAEAIPEPSSALLGGIGLMLLLRRRRREA